MASIVILGFGNYKIAEYKNITNSEVERLHRSYKDESGVYHIETNYDDEDNQDDL